MMLPTASVIWPEEYRKRPLEWIARNGGSMASTASSSWLLPRFRIQIELVNALAASTSISADVDSHGSHWS